MSKSTTNNRISALKRLGQSVHLNTTRRSLSTGPSSSINDARQLLGQRNQSTFDARQLLSRQSSQTLTNSSPTNIVVRKSVVPTKSVTTNDDNGKMVVVTGLKDMKLKDGRLISMSTTENSQTQKRKNIFSVGPSTFVTIRNPTNNNSNNQSTEKISFTKTITNASIRPETDAARPRTADTLPLLSDHKVVISFVNDQCEKTPKTLPTNMIATSTRSSSPLVHHRESPPIIKRLHDASIQTTHSSSSRSPIRINAHQRHTSTTVDQYDDDDDDYSQEDLYEPPMKRMNSSIRKPTKPQQQSVLSTAKSSTSVKRTSAGAPVSSRVTSTMSKQVSTSQSNSTPATILVTNLQPSVTEDDVIELFGEIGRINEIATLSQGCVQIIFAKREYGEQAVTKYHNRLLDGQFMYVSLQQTPPSTAKPSSVVVTSNSKTTNNNPSQTPKDSGISTINQPLKFNTNNNNNNNNNSNSNKTSIDPTFIRQALFHPSNNTTNPVQFQVKL